MNGITCCCLLPTPGYRALATWPKDDQDAARRYVTAEQAVDHGELAVYAQMWLMLMAVSRLVSCRVRLASLFLPNELFFCSKTGEVSSV